MKSIARPVLTALVLLTIVSPSWALKVVAWDLMGYSKWDGPAREAGFRVVLNRLNPDILVVQGMTATDGVARFLEKVMNADKPGAYRAAPVQVGEKLDAAVFWRPSLVALNTQNTITTAYLNIKEYAFRIRSGPGAKSRLWVYNVHFKYGSEDAAVKERETAARRLRNHLNALAPGSQFLVCGNLNDLEASEGAYKILTRSQADDDGRAFDPAGRPGGWHANASYANLHTQSTHSHSGGGHAGGGLDDRFDFILVSQALLDGKGLDYVKGSYLVYGNDGKHFNRSINDAPYKLPKAVLDALYLASDHLPVVVSLKAAPAGS